MLALDFTYTQTRQFTTLAFFSSCHYLWLTARHRVQFEKCCSYILAESSSVPNCITDYKQQSVSQAERTQEMLSLSRESFTKPLEYTNHGRDEATEGYRNHTHVLMAYSLYEFVEDINLLLETAISLCTSWLPNLVIFCMNQAAKISLKLTMVSL